MDLAPRRPAPRAAAPAPVASTPQPTSSPAPTAQPRPTATALHSRLKTTQGRGVLDLRPTQQPTTTPQATAPALAQSTHHTPAPLPRTTSHQRQEAHVANRLEQAKRVARSPLVNKFSEASRLPAAPPQRQSHPAPQPAPAAYTGPELPKLTATQHEAMTRLAPQAPTPPPPAHHDAKPAPRQRLKPSPQHSRVLATAAAIAIMAGYVWVQNYPKLALQNASGKAGLAASLPGYMPSSYTLAGTSTSAGLVTLDFHSPNATEPLKIAQHRTSWDSSSLLDNYVIKNTDDFTSVQGQGLTVYLFGQNQAAWVNHGIWYSIEGASRLSREQILKIAYSL